MSIYKKTATAHASAGGLALIPLQQKLCAVVKTRTRRKTRRSRGVEGRFDGTAIRVAIVGKLSNENAEPGAARWTGPAENRAVSRT